MFRMILCLAVAFSAALAGKDECKKLGHPRTLECCKLPPPDHMQDLKECGEKIKLPPNCEADICVATKLGYAGSEDGKFDKKAVEMQINKDFESVPEIAEAVIKNCVNGDLTEFGPADFCDLMKLRHCIQMHLILNCPEWDSSGKCSEIKDLVTKCSVK